MKTEKPEGMTWQQYSVFLLESIGLYVPELRDHYYKKIKGFLKQYEKKEGILPSQVKDEEDKKLENLRRVPSWRRIARAIERNDFWMKRLNYSQSKTDAKKLVELQKKYKNMIDKNDSHFKGVQE